MEQEVDEGEMEELQLEEKEEEVMREVEEEKEEVMTHRTQRCGGHLHPSPGRRRQQDVTSLTLRATLGIKSISE